MKKPKNDIAILQIAMYKFGFSEGSYPKIAVLFMNSSVMFRT
jgi:hypothetical protein